MDFLNDKISLTYITLFFAFVLPGAITMYFYSLITPQEAKGLKEKIPEAICFSLINFILLLHFIRPLFDAGFLHTHPYKYWLHLAGAFIGLPIIWPFLFVQGLRWIEYLGFIRPRAHTAWDDFFGKQVDGAWVILELKDGGFIGGKFGKDSFASAWPEPGHLYIEELWEVDPSGQNFTDVPILPKRGIILRPDDYKHIRVL